MTRDAFIERVIEEITEGRSMPVSPKRERINSIINDAKRYFKEYDDEASQFEYIIISSGIVNTPLFKAKRQIKLPDCVIAVTSLNEMGTWYNTANINPDFRKTNFNYHLAAAGDSDTMLYGVVASYYADFLRNFIVRTISYEYNNNTHALTLRGRDNFIDAVAGVYTVIPDEGMFEIDRFFRYVVGKCKISFGNVFSLVDAKLLGGLNLNVKEIKQDGKDLVKEVKDEIDGLRDSADFIEEY